MAEEKQEVQEKEQQQLNPTPNPQPVQDEAYSNLLKEVQEIKKNTVSREEYDRQVDRNKQLTKALVENQTQKEQPTPQAPDAQQLRTELFGSKKQDLNNLDYVTKALELRKQAIESGQRDPFLPTGGKDANSYTERERAERVASGLQQMVDEAKGNPDTFRRLMEENMEDDPVLVRNKFRGRY